MPAAVYNEAKLTELARVKKKSSQSVMYINTKYVCVLKQLRKPSAQRKLNPFKSQHKRQQQFTSVGCLLYVMVS